MFHNDHMITQSSPNRDNLRGQFDHNCQKLHENYKLNILLGKTVGGEGHGRDKPIFKAVRGCPPVPPKGEGNPVRSAILALNLVLNINTV